MDENNFMLVFFDTFDHGQKLDVQLDSIKFSQPVKIGLIRIVPFGVAIETELDSEARLGITNPQNFNVKFYTHKGDELPAFDKIGEIDFDEKNGVNSIHFPAMPLASILSVSGCYNMLSIAVFGIISPRTSNSDVNLNTNQSNNLILPNIPMSNINSGFPPNFRNFLGTNPVALNLMNQVSTAPLLSNAPQVSVESTVSNPTNMLLSLALAASGGNNPGGNFMRSSSITSMSDISKIIQPKIEPSFSMSSMPKHEPMQPMQPILSNIKPEQQNPQACLYEDGEIQENDYEDVSSNDEILFDMDDDLDLLGIDSRDGLKNQHINGSNPNVTSNMPTMKRISTGFPDLDNRLVTDRWRFIPKKVVVQNQLLAQLRIIPHSNKTVFEVEYDRLCREECENGSSNTNIAVDIPQGAITLINLVSDYNTNKLTSEWVDEMEKLPSIISPGLAYLTYADKETAKNVIESLLSWTRLGLSAVDALKQSRNLYILRHLRAGISLAGYMCTLEQSITKQLFKDPSEFHVQHALFDLLNSPLKLVEAPPLQLQIIRALDLSTRLLPGLEAFITSNGNYKSPYQRLVRFLLDKRVGSRVVMACSRLLNKTHLYESLVNFRANITRLKQNLNESTESHHLLDESNRLMTEIIRYFINANDMIANPRKSMPCASLFDQSLHKPHNPYPNILHMFDITHLLDSIDWLLSISPNNNGASVNFQLGSRIDKRHHQLVANSMKLLWELTQKHESLVYLMTSQANQSTDRILKRLFGLDVAGIYGTGQNEMALAGIVPQNNIQTPALEPNLVWMELGSEICVKLECLHWLDELLSWCKQVGGLNVLAKQMDKLEDCRLASILLGLAKLTGERRGAAWISQVLTMDDNLAPILPILEALEKKMIHEEISCESDLTKDNKISSKSTRKSSITPSGSKSLIAGPTSSSSSTSTRVPLPHSICLHYLPNLLASILKHADDVSYFGKYGARLARLGTNRDAPVQKSNTDNEIAINSNNGPFTEARDWLQPLTDMPTASPLDIECLGHLVEHLRSSISEVDMATVPPALITVLRLLRLHMGQSPSATCHPNIKCGSGGLETKPNQLLGNGVCGEEEELFVFGKPSDLRVDCVRFKYAITEFYHLDGLPILIKLIQQISDQHQLSWQCGIEYIDSRYPQLLTVIELACAIVAAVTKRLIQCRKQYYKDTTSLHALFSCYTVFCSDYVIGQHHVSYSRYLAQLESIRQSIVSTVLAFTQSQLPDEENEKARNLALEKSLWTCMLRELLNFTISAPYAFVGGLTLLIELLPLPLPIKSTTPLTDPEICQVRNSRALWSAHLLCCRSELQMMIHQLGCSSSPIIQQLLARLLSLISGMGPAATYSVVRCCLEKLCNVWEAAKQELERHNDRISQNNVTDLDDLNKLSNSNLLTSDAFLLDSTMRHHPDSLELTRTFSMIRLLLTIPACKHAFLKLIGQRSATLSSFDTSESDNFEIPFMKIIADILDANKENHTATQEQLILSLQILLDARITMEVAPKSEPIGMDDMIFGDGTSSSSSGNIHSINRDQLSSSNVSSSHLRLAASNIISNQQIIDALPNREQCIKIIHLLVLHATNPEQDMATIPAALKTLVILVGHDYGFRILHEVLEMEKAMFLSLMKRVNETFSTDNPDCQLSLLTTLNLLQALVLRNRAVPSSIASCTDNSTTTTACHAAYRGIGRTSLLSIQTRMLPQRTLNFSDDYVKHSLLQWAGSKEANITHPITELHGLLKIVSEEEESLQVLRDGLESLIELLSKSDIIIGNLEGVQGTSEMMPWPQRLEDIFDARGLVWIIPLDQFTNIRSSRPGSISWQQMMEDEDRMEDKCWFGPVEIDEDKDTPELSRCDLENLAYVCCNGFNLHDELARGRQQDDEAIRHKKRRKGHDAIIHTGRSTKKFVAPMRGRGFGVRSSATLSSSGVTNPIVSTGHHHSSSISNTNISMGISQSTNIMMGNTNINRNHPRFANSTQSSNQAQYGGTGINTNSISTNIINPGSAITNIAGIPPGTSLSINDPFRSRPPNTSRPPSMHVDDFQKLQKDEKVEEEIMTRERNLRSLRGGRTGLRNFNMGNRSIQK